MMAKKNEKFLFKVVILLLTFFIAISLVFTATYSRYLTESEHNIGFLAKKQPQILFNGAEIDDRALISIWDWTQGENQINGKFNLSVANLPEGEGVDFYIRAFIKSSSAEPTIQNEEVELTQEVTQPTEVSLTLGNDTFNSAAHSIDDEADFHIKNGFSGDVYHFFANEQLDPHENEYVFHLEEGENAELDFVLNVYDSEIITNRIYICIEIVK